MQIDPVINGIPWIKIWLELLASFTNKNMTVKIMPAKNNELKYAKKQTAPSVSFFAYSLNSKFLNVINKMIKKAITAKIEITKNKYAIGLFLNQVKK